MTEVARMPVVQGDPEESAAPDALPAFLIDEELELELGPGSRTIVVSDLHLPVVATPTSTAVADELAGLLASVDGPAVFVIAGDGFEMLAGPPEVDRILDSHPQFAAATAELTINVLRSIGAALLYTRNAPQAKP